MSFFSLPVEIRLAIYDELFGQGIAAVRDGRQDVGSESKAPSVLPEIDSRTPLQPRSAQILRTCKTVLAEAAPILYNNTIFRTNFEAFAGRLPVQMTAGNPSASKIHHLEWSLKCDLLKKYDPTELLINPQDTQSLRSVQIVCQAANWREPICGEWCDQEAFVRGRQQVIDFGKALQESMRTNAKQVTLLEDLVSLQKGRVMLRLREGCRRPTANVSPVYKTNFKPLVLTLYRKR